MKATHRPKRGWWCSRPLPHDVCPLRPTFWNFREWFRYYIIWGGR